MKLYTKIYLKHFGYGEQDFIPCEACGREAVDVHHISGRGPGKDVIENLMGVCRKCHDKAHNETLSESDMLYIHNNFMTGNKKQFIL